MHSLGCREKTTLTIIQNTHKMPSRDSEIVVSVRTQVYVRDWFLLETVQKIIAFTRTFYS